MTRKRCNPKENWEEQMLSMAEYQKQQYQMAGGAFSEEFKQNWLENNMVLRDSSYHPRFKTRTYRERLQDEIARLQHLSQVRAQQVRMMRQPSASTMSWSPAKNDDPDRARNANRMAAPVGWEATGEQERGSVMAVLGGRKNRR